MEDVRKEIKKKFDFLNPTQLGLIGYWYKLYNEYNHKGLEPYKNSKQTVYFLRIKEILKEVK